MAKSTLRSIIGGLMPRPVTGWYRLMRNTLRRRVNKKLPTREVFSRIYASGEWGGDERLPCSGTGSTLEHAAAYAEVVRGCIQRMGARSVIDLGCGDFTVGQALQMDGVRYVGVDIVESVIAKNRVQHKGPETEFLCLDIIEDNLPDGDCCLIRQVLQHLSNAQISTILSKLEKYPCVVITEHYPSPSVRAVPNKDKPHGGDTRIIEDSAVYLDQPPFRLRNLEEILSVPVTQPIRREGERIVSYMWTPRSQNAG